AHTIARMLHEPAVVIRLRLRSAVAKPGRRLRAGFVVTVRDATTGLAVTRPILVTWQVLRGNLPVLLPEPAGPEVPASVAAPFRSLTAADPDRAMRLWAWPFDPAFGQLAWLADPANAARLLSGQSRGERSGPEAGYAVTPLRYVPGAAHVLRYDPLGGGRRVVPRTGFAKPPADPL